jgi:hypothetical protein
VAHADAEDRATRLGVLRGLGGPRLWIGLLLRRRGRNLLLVGIDLAANDTAADRSAARAAHDVDARLRRLVGRLHFDGTRTTRRRNRARCRRRDHTLWIRCSFRRDSARRRSRNRDRSRRRELRRGRMPLHRRLVLDLDLAGRFRRTAVGTRLALRALRRLRNRRRRRVGLRARRNRRRRNDHARRLRRAHRLEQVRLGGLLRHRRLNRRRLHATLGLAIRPCMTRLRRRDHLLPRTRAVVADDRQMTEAHELDAEHSTRGRVICDELLDDVRLHRGVRDRVRRVRVHETTRQQSRQHALDAARHAAQDALVHVIERKPDELRDEKCGIQATHLQRATRANADGLAVHRQHELRDHVEADFDRRGEHEVRGRWPRGIGSPPPMTSGTQSIADHPRRAHHDELVFRAGHLVLLRTDWERPGVNEMVRRDGVARDDRHQRDTTGSRRGKVRARRAVKCTERTLLAGRFGRFLRVGVSHGMDPHAAHAAR